MAFFVLAPSGSHGDVHPFLAVGKALQSRGHRVAMSTSEHFRNLAVGAGFEFLPVGTEADFQATIENPDLWHPSKSLKVLFSGELFRRLLRDSYRNLTTSYIRGETVIVAGSLAVAARIVQESLGAPLATVHLQPMGYPSVSDPPLFPTLRIRRWWPRWWVRCLYWIGDRVMLDPMIAPAVNELRMEAGLKPIRRIWGQWRHSPQCILGFFPEWYGRARDWPPHFECTGFVRYDQSDTQTLSPDVESFLRSGEPPVIVSIGSAMKTGRAYFEAAISACAQVGKRSLILARGGDQIPPLRPSALHAEYAPFSKVFPRAAAVIHHGGIGTCAQALAAGVPQLVMPLAFDQFDNAERLERFGVARSVPAKRFTADRAAAALRELIADPGTSRSSAELQKKMESDPMPRIVERLEALIGRDATNSRRSSAS